MTYNVSSICFAAFFNITSNILRTNQTFNLTVQDSCTDDYTVDFGDGTTADLTSGRKMVLHYYISPGNYEIQVRPDSAQQGCKNASKSVEVRDPIQNMVRNVFRAQFTTEWERKKRNENFKALLFHTTMIFYNINELINGSPPGGGGRYFLVWVAPKGMVFQPLWS